MQTFLPYPSLVKSILCLDSKRLGKQRVEARQILNSLWEVSPGWRNHPAVKMWKGYEGALIMYSNIAIVEWVRRGFKNSMPILPLPKVIYPRWFGEKNFHASHRSNLLRKAPDYYSRFNWREKPDLPYIWPVN